MIRAVTAINLDRTSNNAITMRLNSLNNGPFTLWKIDGIGPGVADINVTELASTDGASYNSARQNSREITLTLVYNWFDGSIEAARHYSYQYFPLKKRVRLIIYSTDNLEQHISIVKQPTIARYIDGYVMQNNPDIFASTCATEIVLKCPDPYFYACDPIIPTSGMINVANDFKTVIMGEPISAFHFPFYSVGNDLVFGYIPDSNDIINVTYPEYAIETGAYFVFRFSRQLEDAFPLIIIENVSTSERFIMDFSVLQNYVDFSSGLQADDIVVVSSVPGKKNVSIIRGEYVTSIIGVISYDSIWPMVYPGSNTFRCYSDFNLPDAGVSVELNYNERYQGI